MDKIEALERIKAAWNDTSIDLAQKITTISDSFYGVGLDLPSTAEYIKATPAELDAILALGALSDEVLQRLSSINPPRTTWELFAYAGEDEINQALTALEHNKEDTSSSEYVYRQMSEVSGPTIEQMVGRLSASDIARIRKKAEQFNALSTNEIKFLKSIASRKMKQELSPKQISWFVSILINLAEKGVIKRNSIDGDADFCDRILDSIGK